MSRARRKACRCALIGTLTLATACVLAQTQTATATTLLPQHLLRDEDLRDLANEDVWWADGAKHFAPLDSKENGMRVLCSETSTTLYQHIHASGLGDWNSLELRVRLSHVNINPSRSDQTSAFAGLLVLVQPRHGEDIMWELEIPSKEDLRALRGNLGSFLNISQVGAVASMTLGVTCTGFEGSFDLEHVELNAEPRETMIEAHQVVMDAQEDYPPTPKRHVLGDLARSAQLPSDTTLCSHASADRIAILAVSIAQWQRVHNGGASVASIALWNGPNTKDDAKTLIGKLAEALAYEEVNMDLMRIEIQVRERRRVDEPYPINALRNLGLSAVETEFALLLDADLLPGGDFVRALQHGLQVANEDELTGSMGVLHVLPAFEENRPSRGHSICRKAARATSKTSLNSLVRRGLVAPYKAVHQPRAHGATDVAQWLRDREEGARPYEVEAVAQYEPYVVVRIQDLGGGGGTGARHISLFDERFEGYGWNKVAMISELIRLGFRFLVLQEAWVVHCAHEKSSWSRAFSADPRARLRNRAARFQWAVATEDRFASCDA
ncbi:LARGE xylosyl- and glucuronyltransferase 1 [Hondaea fermentalgiana]|uniref:LARGE xylosyl-and glucuronyltransferase 1 n=1 Tax=Hondaea fermentalgiana TaxID=2315210 RepID=A0A2R5GTE5_9STRA|nr:LARGE xylosyl- and glucuronyltransferase 1 [Hondaea fermentalgiana]|eukprot:GBG33599.1 LARGE xylosyl- and glucuronyltransferase 1 [Hondaea fermentalgiana]